MRNSKEKITLNFKLNKECLDQGSLNVRAKKLQ